MSEEREFSFLNLFKYALRYLVIIVLCAMLGAGIGVLGIARRTNTNYERYTGVLQFNLVKYMDLTHPGETLSEGDYAVSARQVSQILETACGSVVYSKTFNEYADRLYPNTPELADRTDMFYQSLIVGYATDSLVVNFYHDIKSEEDRTLAKEVIATYLQYAQENIKANYPQFAEEAYANVLSTVDAQRDLSLPEEIKESNAKPELMSGVVNVVIYAVIGGALGCGIVFAMYFLDPRLKSVKDVFVDPAQSDVIDVGEEGAVTEFLARLKGIGVRRLLLAAPVQDAKLESFAAELEAQLKEMGNGATVINFSAEDSAWLTYFDNKVLPTGYEIYLYNEVNANAAFYLSSKVEATAFFVDQSRVKVKLLRTLAQQLNGSKYVCTLIHSQGNVYLD